MLHKINYPLLGLLAQLSLTPVLVVARLLGLVHWSWGAVLGLPLMLAVVCVLLGLLEYLVVRVASSSRRPEPPTHLVTKLPTFGYELLGVPHPRQASGNIRK